MDITQEKYLKPGEVCKLLRIARSTLWSLRKSGAFTPSIKIGKSERYTMADIEKLITISQEVKPPPTIS
jgi:predicted DNA-binding transcriptional regulator AlpA